MKEADLPGSRMIPAPCAVRSLLALKLFGAGRHSQWGVRFITLRRRSETMLETIARQPRSAWRRIELDNIARLYRTPRVLEEKTALCDYDGPIRQLIVADVGHEQPTVLLTNQMRPATATLIGRHAQRMLIENNIQDGAEFFHIDALPSAVALNVDGDLQLTLMASSLYRLLGAQIGHGHERAKSRHLFRDFVDAAAQVRLTEDELLVRFQKRAHNPLLRAAGFDTMTPALPWLGGKRLRLVLR